MFLPCTIQMADTATSEDLWVIGFPFSHCAMTDISKNWRAVLAMLVTVGPTFPGLINSINPAVNVGYTIRLFDIAWLYGVSSHPSCTCRMYAQLLLTCKFVVASTVYYVTSALFPPRETFVQKLILADDTALDHFRGDNSPIETSDGKGDDGKVHGEE